MALNRPDPSRILDSAPLLGIDQTTLTAALKPLERRGFIVGRQDKRGPQKPPSCADQDGRDILKATLPVWRDTHDLLDQSLEALSPDLLREGLDDIAGGSTRGRPRWDALGGAPDVIPKLKPTHPLRLCGQSLYLHSGI